MFNLPIFNWNNLDGLWQRKLFLFLNFFCNYIFQILVYFYVKIENLPVSQQPPLKTDILASLPFLKFDRSSTAPPPPPAERGRGRGVDTMGESDEISRIFCGHVNFPEMNERDTCIGETKFNNHKEGC